MPWAAGGPMSSMNSVTSCAAGAPPPSAPHAAPSGEGEQCGKAVCKALCETMLQKPRCLRGQRSGGAQAHPGRSGGQPRHQCSHSSKERDRVRDQKSETRRTVSSSPVEGARSPGVPAPASAPAAAPPATFGLDPATSAVMLKVSVSAVALYTGSFRMTTSEVSFPVALSIPFTTCAHAASDVTILSRPRAAAARLAHGARRLPQRQLPLGGRLCRPAPPRHGVRVPGMPPNGRGAVGTCASGAEQRCRHRPGPDGTPEGALP